MKHDRPLTASEGIVRMWRQGSKPTFLERQRDSSDNHSDPQLGPASNNRALISPYSCPRTHCL